MQLKKKGQQGVAGAVIGAMTALIAFVVIIVVSGLINTVAADVVDDIRDDMTDGSTAEAIANQTLTNQQTVATRTGTFTTSGLGLLLIGVIVTVVGGFLGSRVL